MSLAGTTWLAIGERPAGSWSRTEVSRSPKTVMATVRGIGVAVITSRCGGCLPLLRRASRCSTPKRCCSSTTTSPRSWNCTLSSIRAWVPTTIPASPVTRASSAWRRAAAPMEPVSNTTLVPAPRRRASALGQLPHHLGDRAVVLLGQDLGRRQHRGLAAAVDHTEHGAQRDHGVVRDGEVVGHIGVAGMPDADALDGFAADVLDGLDGAAEAGAALRVTVGPARHRTPGARSRKGG